LIALLDAIHLSLAVVSGKYVPPALIVLVVQLMIPLTALLAQCFRPNGRCRAACSSVVHDDEGVDEPPRTRTVRNCAGLSTEHIVGSLIVTAAVMMSLIPSVWDPTMIHNDEGVPTKQASYNTILFTVSTIPAAASQLYKENTLLRHKHPIDPNYFNLVLSIFQFFIIFILSPLVFRLQGLGMSSNEEDDPWYELYPSRNVGINFLEGLECFLEIQQDHETTRREHEAHCFCSWVLALIHVVCIVLVGIAVNKIVKAGATSVLFRVVNAGILVAATAMILVDNAAFHNGPLLESFYFGCALLLILGSEVYYRVRPEDSTFETEYVSVGNIYGEDQE